MQIAEEFFAPWEHVVTDWRSAWEEIDVVLTLSGSRRLAWRGMVDSGYALHSSLFRAAHRRLGALPDEDDLVALEEQILQAARTRWRFDNLSALETLAQLQHFGAPTRLLDVSLNPLVALWFAVEQQYDSDGAPVADKDGRLVVFDVTDRDIELDGRWGGRELPWRSKPIEVWRTGLPRLWRPPSYNDRIPAQNSAFLVGGVPQLVAQDASRYRKGPGDQLKDESWPIAQVRQVTSLSLRMSSLDRKPHGSSRPTFTLRIEAGAKEGIRHHLEQNFGLNAASIYPDLYGLARYGVQGLLSGPVAEASTGG